MKFKNYIIYILCFCLQGCGEAKKEQLLQNADPETGFYSLEDFDSVQKYDTHVHINVDDSAFINQAERNNFRLLTINVNPPYYPSIEEQQEVALKLVEAYPQTLSYATTFNVANWGSEEWQQQTISYLEKSFGNGAIAVKIWKNIGMDLREKDGQFVMIDNPRFDPILDLIEKNNVTLIGHLGEPRNAWLPIEEMTITGDQSYFAKNPKYHMYLQKDFPSYQDQIDARDRMLVKHPNLKFVGAHLGSLEWNIDKLANHFDEFPNVAVDMAARVPHLQFQSIDNREKVRDFIIKYQDRLIYSTDLSIESISNPDELKKTMNDRWVSDWRFFVTDDEMKVSAFSTNLKGLKLPKAVIDKIYRGNAKKWFPSLI